jgi:hypothetical protein
VLLQHLTPSTVAEVVETMGPALTGETAAPTILISVLVEMVLQIASGPALTSEPAALIALRNNPE